MKITLVGPTHPFKGGVSHYNTVLYKYLSKKYNVNIVSFKRQYPQLLIKLLFKAKEQKDTSSQQKFEVQNKPIIDSINPLTWFKTLKEIKKQNSDLVILYWWTPFWTFFNYFISKFVKAKKLCICHNIIPHENTIFDRILTKIALKNFDYYIVHSKSSEIELKKLLPNSNIKVSPHPIYDIFKSNKIKTKNQAKKLLNIEENIILFFGYVRKYKGLEYLIKAMPEILKKNNLKLLIVGQFWGKQKYLDLIKEYNLENNIIIIDDYVPNEEVEKYFKASDVIVLPYTSATNSGIIQTAFAFNKPIIATNTGGLPEIVLDNKTGFIVQPKNPEQLAEAVIKFYEDKKEEEFITNIKKDKKRFSWDKMVETIEGFWKW